MKILFNPIFPFLKDILTLKMNVTQNLKLFTLKRVKLKKPKIHSFAHCLQYFTEVLRHWLLQT